MGIDVECTHVLVQRCLRRTYDDLLTKICIVQGIIINFASQHTIIVMWMIMTYCYNKKLFYIFFYNNIKVTFFLKNNLKAINVERKS